ncbi:glycine oxidase ThiO [Planctomicrobium sp. SH661]|uniref:glycine oxidase ThiO n=1 Tax=Planctomicrobium sp. SH661 TaxID=3448124 RepID=UPI003F5CB79C
MQDVVIVGGGVIGLSIAWELAGEGLRVSVLDQSAPGQEASWAGAGMIPPGDLLHAPTHELAVLSLQRWPELSAALRSETGLQNEYSRCGGLLLPDDTTTEELAAAWRALHVTADVLNASQLRTRIPGLSADVSSAVWLPDMAQVRNPRHLKALEAGCRARGVELLSGQQVIQWDKKNGRLLAAITQNSRFESAEFVVAAGAWTPQVLAGFGLNLPIQPVHGQIALLQSQHRIFPYVIEQGRRYLVPRQDGRVLVGATEERIGFQKRNTEEAISDLLQFAHHLIPELATCPVEKMWSGLRPWSGLGHPTLGRVEEFSNLFLAAGHYRAGLSNSPGTALVMRQLILGEPPTIDLSAFRPEISTP